MKLVEDESSDVRKTSLWALNNIVLADPTIIEPILDTIKKLLEDKDPDTRLWATGLLAAYADTNPRALENTISKIIDLAHRDPGEIKAFAVHALSVIADREPELLLNYFKDIVELVDKIRNRDQLLELLVTIKKLGAVAPEKLLEHADKIAKLLRLEDDTIAGYAKTILGLITGQDKKARPE